MKLGNCLNCHSESFNLHSFDFQLNENSKNITSNAFEKVLLLQKFNSVNVRTLRLCRLCAEQLSLYIHSKQTFLKLTKPKSKISNLFLTESEDFISNTNDGIRKYQDQQNIGQVISNRDKNDKNISSWKNGKTIIEYQELFLKLKVEKLPDSKSSKTCHMSSTLYKCSECSRMFSDSQQLINHHAFAHSPTHKVLICKICDAKFAMVWFLKNHLHGCHNHEGGFYICKLCQNYFHTKEDLEKHSLKEHDEASFSLPYNCKHCKEEFITIRGLRKHLIKTHKGTAEANFAENNTKTLEERKLNTSKCLFCEECFKNFSSRYKHINSKHADETKNCEICQQQFKCYDKLLQHQRSHRKCPICKKKFRTHHIVKNHIDLVHVTLANRPYVCEMCGQKYSHPNSLGTHYTWHANVRRPSHFCNICNRTYKLKAHLNQHMKHRHSLNTKKHKCRHCVKIFTTKAELNTHITKKHNPELKYPCKICGKKFLNSSGASTHSRIHTLETKNEDIKCLKRDKKKYAYKSQKKSDNVSSNGKLEVMACYSSKTYLFTCPICKKSTDSQTHFFRHLRTLHNLEGYADPNIKVKSIVKCLKCDKEFARKDLMDKHRRKVHNKLGRKIPPPRVARIDVRRLPPRYNCSYCEKVFTNSTLREFKAHVKMHKIYIAEDVINTPAIKTEVAKFYNEHKKTFTCHVCKRDCETRKAFFKHLKTKSHSNVKIIYDYKNKSK